jgi:hypothetical protein
MMEMIDVSRLDLSAAGFRCHHKTVGRFASARFRRSRCRSVKKTALFRKRCTEARVMSCPDKDRPIPASDRKAGMHATAPGQSLQGRTDRPTLIRGLFWRAGARAAARLKPDVFKTCAASLHFLDRAGGTPAVQLKREGVRREALGVRAGGRPAIQVRPFFRRLWRSELVVGWRPFFVRWEVRDD